MKQIGRRISLPSASSLLIVCLAACAAPPRMAATGGDGEAVRVETGYILDVRDVTVRDGRSAPLAPVVGAILGGVAGSMVGSGTGRALASAGGAVGGSVLAREASKPGDARIARIRVRLGDGRENTYDAAPEQAFRPGERVQVVSRVGSKPELVRLSGNPR